MALHAAAAAGAIDGLATHGVGGLDFDAFSCSLADLRRIAAELQDSGSAPAAAVSVAGLGTALDGVQAGRGEQIPDRESKGRIVRRVEKFQVSLGHSILLPEGCFEYLVLRVEKRLGNMNGLQVA